MAESASPPASAGVPRARGVPVPPSPPPPPEDPKVPFLLDFYPLEDARSTRLSAFYDGLKEGKFRTTRCARDGLLWPPRVVCPTCHTEELVWADLPMTGTVYAFSAVLAGAPLGMEAEVPFVVGLVDLEGTGLRVFGRIAGRPWTELAIGQRVGVEFYRLADGRAFFRFRS
jgi:uncharacterized OB-fold protein